MVRLTTGGPVRRQTASTVPAATFQRYRAYRTSEDPVANHVSALKRANQNNKRRDRNRAGRATNRTEVKKFLAAVEAGAGAGALPVLMSQLAGSAAKGTIPKKRAARKIARLSKKLHAASK